MVSSRSYGKYDTAEKPRSERHPHSLDPMPGLDGLTDEVQPAGGAGTKHLSHMCRKRKGTIQVVQMKVALFVLCAGRLLDKLKCEWRGGGAPGGVS